MVVSVGFEPTIGLLLRPYQDRALDQTERRDIYNKKDGSLPYRLFQKLQLINISFLILFQELR